MSKDPRLAVVLSHFDHLVEFARTWPFFEADERDSELDALLTTYMRSTFGFDFHGWPVESYRRMIVAFLDAAPEDEVDNIVDGFYRDNDWLDTFKLTNEYETTFDLPAVGDEYEAWKAQRLAADTQAVAS